MSDFLQMEWATNLFKIENLAVAISADLVSLFIKNFAPSV